MPIPNIICFWADSIRTNKNNSIFPLPQQVKRQKEENFMQIRSFQEEDWRILLRLYNECYPADPVSGKFFLEHLILEPNFNADGVFIAEENGVVVGAAVSQIITRNLSPWKDQVSKMQGKGFIMPLIFFTKETGRALLERSERYFAENNIEKVRITSTGAYLFPDGIDPEGMPLLAEVLEECGYLRTSHTLSMRCDLFKWVLPDSIREKIESAQKDGIIAKVCELSDLPAVRRFFTSGDLIERMQNVAKKLASDELDEVVIIRSPEEVLGYCQYNYFGEPDRVGPFGISQTHRGRGLGQIMVAKLLETMKCRGLRHAWFASCSENNSFFYEKNHFERFRTKYVFEKTLKENAI